MRQGQFKVNSQKMVKYGKKKKKKEAIVVEKYISQNSERTGILNKNEEEMNTERTVDHNDKGKLKMVTNVIEI